MHRIPARLLAVLVSLALLLAGTFATSAAADAKPAYTKMTSTELTYARSVLALMNNQRAEHGLKKLRMSRVLKRSAGAHNRAMAKVNQISHRLPGERDFTGRMRTAGWKHRCASAENVGVNSQMDRAGANQLQTLMYNEVAPNDGHRVNLLGRRYTSVGVSVLLDNAHHQLWLTIDFGQRRC